MGSKVFRKPFGRPPGDASQPGARRLSIRPAVLYIGFAVLMTTNALTLVGLLMAPDIARVFAGQNQAVIDAYEDRLGQLRLEVDRLQSRHYAQTGDINLQLQELAQAQEVLTEQHQYVKQLADRAAALGINAASLPAGGSDEGDAAAVASVKAGPTDVVAKTSDAAAEVAAATASVDRMMSDSRLALTALSDEATTRTDRIMGTLAGIGIKPRLDDATDDDDAMGGPLLPPVDTPDSPSIVDDANDVSAALARYKSALDAADGAPVHMPLTSIRRISSTFGNRTDPFTGRRAFHPGIDFAATWGSTVMSAGAGKVIFVGQISGYGNAVEIDHGHGLVTLYGHLSSFIVKQGQTVDTGTPIARVGSTGRSTGPHLHFEIRRSDTAVDPARYLAAGRVLAKILAG